MPIDTPEQIASSLGSACAQSERGFLAAGQSLEGAVEILDRLTRTFAAYVSEVTGGALAETSRGLANVSARIAAVAGMTQSDMAALAPPGAAVADVGRHVAALIQITREVETLSLSARVVAGGMDAAGADFLIFSASIKRAAQSARASLQDVAGGLGRMGKHLDEARADAAVFHGRHGETLRSVSAHLAESARNLETHQGLAAGVATAARRQSDEVRQQVSDQIVALQLGDVIRQRVEHVRAGGYILSETGGLHGQAGQLLAAQLRDTADVLSTEGGQIEKRLAQLATAAGAIGRLGTELHGENTVHRGGFIAGLAAGIRRTLSPLAELRAADAATEQRVVAVLEAAEQLAPLFASLQFVEEDIRIMGLNATLKCRRLGTIGRPLAAVARELRACAGRFAKAAEAALRDLERLRSIARALRDPAREARHTALAEAADGMLTALIHLGELESEFETALAALQADAASVGRLVEDTLTGFSVRHALAVTLREAADAFASWTDAAEAATGDARDMMDRVAMSYTMAREREVHARFVPLPPEYVPATRATVSTAADELSDILF